MAHTVGTRSTHRGKGIGRQQTVLSGPSIYCCSKTCWLHPWAPSDCSMISHVCASTLPVLHQPFGFAPLCTEIPRSSCSCSTPEVRSLTNTRLPFSFNCAHFPKTASQHLYSETQIRNYCFSGSSAQGKTPKTFTRGPALMMNKAGGGGRDAGE